MTKEANNPMSSKALKKFTQMMIDLIEKKPKKWESGFIDLSYTGWPQNLDGRKYKGGNAFFLNLASQMKGDTMPVYMTFHQAMENNCSVKKGEQSMPVIFYTPIYYDAEKKRVGEKELATMSAEEKAQLTVKPVLKSYNVFNIDQTTFQEVNPEKYQRLKEIFSSDKQLKAQDTNGMYNNEALERMFDKNEWLCPVVRDRQVGTPCYMHSDMIKLPEKIQYAVHDDAQGRYEDGMNFYGTALHEMAHSTGHPDRLNRTKGDRFGDAKYAKEELVAEMTAATVGNAMGFSKSILENNAAYLESWLGGLKESPLFIKSVMADVGKASEMIMKEVDKQYIALGKQPMMQESQKEDNSRVVTPVKEMDSSESLPDGRKINFLSVFKDKIVPGEPRKYKARAKVDGFNLRVKEISKDDFYAYVKKELSKSDLVTKYYRKELEKNVGRKHTAAMAR